MLSTPPAHSVTLFFFAFEKSNRYKDERDSHFLSNSPKAAKGRKSGPFIAVPHLHFKALTLKSPLQPRRGPRGGLVLRDCALAVPRYAGRASRRLAPPSPRSSLPSPTCTAPRAKPKSVLCGGCASRCSRFPLLPGSEIRKVINPLSLGVRSETCNLGRFPEGPSRCCKV